MNRRTFLKSVPAMAMLASVKTCFSADANTSPQAQQVIQTGDVIKLNKPDLKKGILTMEALSKRMSDRNYSDKKLTLQQLSEVLWAADGVNRPDGKRTAPTAIFMYAVDIYAVLPEGVYRYDVEKHELNIVAKGDFRKDTGTQEYPQDFVSIVPLNLVYVLNRSKNWQAVNNKNRDRWVAVELGCIAENVNLYCASEGLGSVVRGLIDENRFSKMINVKPEQVLLAQTVGYLK
jgi:SagB-type dehydrogenase family enzyme